MFHSLLYSPSKGLWFASVVDFVLVRLLTLHLQYGNEESAREHAPSWAESKAQLEPWSSMPEPVSSSLSRTKINT